MTGPTENTDISPETTAERLTALRSPRAASAPGSLARSALRDVAPMARRRGPRRLGGGGSAWSTARPIYSYARTELLGGSAKARRTRTRLVPRAFSCAKLASRPYASRSPLRAHAGGHRRAGRYGAHLREHVAVVRPYPADLGGSCGTSAGGGLLRTRAYGLRRYARDAKMFLTAPHRGRAMVRRDRPDCGPAVPSAPASASSWRRTTPSRSSSRAS